jgi:hypothetical protein
LRSAASGLHSSHDRFADHVRFDDHTMWVELSDGRTLGVPQAWFPRLLRASPAERAQVELSERRVGKGASRRAHAERQIGGGGNGGHASLCPPYD